MNENVLLTIIATALEKLPRRFVLEKEFCQIINQEIIRFVTNTYLRQHPEWIHERWSVTRNTLETYYSPELYENVMEDMKIVREWIQKNYRTMFHV